ncbi:carbohydrate ABC transporter permease [Tessaracoccus sp. MC1756]|uniref:carbohydrate ABC transporter permease n=1 Tax=Tessaracoccus sp. MC1756 TaxID=2760311 RepID=UPI0016043E8C|nr:sugar ABC transporter permease [Tessaracoccus sp. MC1756]MBB1510981.1 sugar ABC transporter permease [Tessaracoccus sp. MC1756]
MKNKTRLRLLKWGMIGPGLLAIVFLIAFPIVYTINLSLTDTSGPASQGPQPFTGLDNYVEAFTDANRFWPAVWRTFMFSVTALGLELVLGIAIALLLRKPFWGGRLMRTIIMLPLVTSPVAVGAIWLLMLDPNIGVANNLLHLIGIPRQGWLTDPTQALWVLIGIDVWQWTPIVILITMAGLAGMPEDPEEAALVDGASLWQRTWHVVLPLIRNSIVVAAVLRGIDALKTFDLIYATKGPGGGSSNEAETLNVLAYGYSFDYMEYGLAAAILVFFFVFVLALAVLVVKTTLKEE